MSDDSSACRFRDRCIVGITNKETTEKGTDMTTEINTKTAAEWLSNIYKDVPGIWAQFDLVDAAISLTENVEDLNLTSYDDLPALDLMCIMADAKMTTEINYDTAETWIENHYKNVPGIWEQFNLADATLGIMSLCGLGCYNSFDDISRSDLMCIMADAKM